MAIDEIKIFDGVFSNADAEDIPENKLTVCQNARSVNGKLVKTFGIGDKIKVAAPAGLDQLITYIEENISTEYLIIGVSISTGNTVTLYGFVPIPAGSVDGYTTISGDVYYCNGLSTIFDGNTYNDGDSFTGDGSNLGGDPSSGTLDTWTALNNVTGFDIDGTYKHKDAKNPIIIADGILRILPGNLIRTVTQYPQGIWIGYIDRDMYDTTYEETTDYTASFFDFNTPVFIPDSGFFTITKSILGYAGWTGPFAVNDEYIYKFSAIYDGNQESLLGDKLLLTSTITDVNEALEITITMPVASIENYMRITGLPIYRAETLATESYNLLSIIDFLRTNDDLDYDLTDGAYSAQDVAHIPYHGLTLDTTGATTYHIKISAEAFVQIQTPTNAKQDVFFLTAGTPYTGDNYWNSSWAISDDGGATNLADGTTGGYAGDTVIIFDYDHRLEVGKYIGGVIYVDNTTSYMLDDSVIGAVHLVGTDTVSVINDVRFNLMTPSEPYFCINDGTNIIYKFYDIYSSTGEVHPLEGEESIHINGQYAKIIGDRLWQGNILLDPMDERKKHPGWGSYSERQQYDVNPVSNVFRFPDREGGGITGVQEIFENPVFLKKQEIITIFGTKEYPDTPAKWLPKTSAHNIGNIAENGSITALSRLYVCYYDGIYQLTANNLAETDSTPTDFLKVSEEINDVYEALTLAQKIAIVSEYNQATNEVMFLLGSAIWAYSIPKQHWREIVSAITPALMTLDQNAEVLVYQDSDKKVYSFAESESVAFDIRSKVFATSDQRAEVIRNIAITLKTNCLVMLSLYAENNATAVLTKSIASTAGVALTEKYGFKYRAKKYQVGVSRSANSNSAEVHKIRIYHDGE